MVDKPTVDRRRILELSATGTALSVAGCMGQLGGGSRSDREVTVSLRVNQEEIQTRQRELQEQIIAGNTTRQEAQEEIESFRDEMMANSVGNAKEVFESSNLTVEGEIESQGLFLVSGSDSDILDMLNAAVVQALGAGRVFKQVQENRQQQQQRRQPGTNETTDTEPNGNETAETESDGNETTEQSTS